MPTPASQLPAGPNDLARRLAALEREVREMRAARRAAYTAVSNGEGIQVSRPGSSVPAAVISPDLGDGNSGFQTNSTDGSTYARLESGELTFGSPNIPQVVPTGITAVADGGTMDITSGLISGGNQAHIILASGDSDLAPGGGSPMISLEWDGSGTADMLVDIDGILMPRSMAWGAVTITPSASNAPTSFAVTGLNVHGTSFYAQATAVTSVPGTQVTGVGVNNVTSTGLTLWLTRTNTTATVVNWMVIGSWT